MALPILAHWAGRSIFDIEPAALARRGIALRAGLHCAPLAHRTAGTLDTGTLRLSASFFNTPDQADRLVWAVSQVLRENVEL
mgnify:CR=1 FL=1